MKYLRNLKKEFRLSLELVYGKNRAASEAKGLIKKTKAKALICFVSLTSLVLLFELEAILILFFLLASLLYLLLPYKKLREEERRIKEDLGSGLEALINELVLLLSGGLSLESSMRKISLDPPDYISIIRLFEHIEEERELGFSLYVALASYAKLYKSNYMYRFNAALASSAKTGSSSLISNLNELKTRILSEKRAVLRRKAETLSTRLILPLMLSLMAIFGMLLFPIFQQLTM